MSCEAPARGLGDVVFEAIATFLYTEYMSLWSCLFYTLANLAGMLLYWLYKRERAILEGGGRTSNDKDKSKGGSNNSNNHATRLSNIENNNIERRRKRFFATAASVASFLGMSANEPETRNPNFQPFQDHYFSFDDVVKACRRAGFDTCGLIVGVDFSASNQWQGRRTFSGQSLHAVNNKGKILNPYQRVISIIGRILEPFDDDNLIPAFGFGDSHTKGSSVFSLKDKNFLDTAIGGTLTEKLKLWGRKSVRIIGGGEKSGGTGEGGSGDDHPCHGFSEVLERYEEVAQVIPLGAVTDFAPIIDKAVEIVKRVKRYHILIIIADGQVTEHASTVRAIVAASKYPLSIVMVGVGDGPWRTMEKFDDLLPERYFDNFQFLDFHNATASNKKNPEANFALHAMMELPDQYKAIKALGYLD